MSDEEIKKAINKVGNLAGMTTNERLFASGLINEFDQSMKIDKSKARRILEMLQVDKNSIDKITR